MSAAEESVTEAVIESAELVSRGSTSVELSTGKTVAIHKCTVKHLGPVLRCLSDVFISLGVRDFADIDLQDLNHPGKLLHVLGTNAEAVFATASGLTDLTEQQMQELGVDDALIVLMAVSALNRDFFLQAILPKIQPLLAQDSKQDQSGNGQSGEPDTNSSTTSRRSSRAGGRRRRSSTSR